MTMLNQVFSQDYGKEFTSATKTRVSNALLVGEIIGQLVIGLTCDYMGRKWAIVTTTLMIVIGGIIATAAHGTTTAGMFWMFTIGRGITGFGTGGEYPASSTAASEAANETVKRRGTVFVLVTNLPLSFGNPFAISIFLIVLCAAGTDHLSTVWRVCAGIGCIWPLTVFYFRLKMSTSELYQKGAIRKRVPYRLVLKYYWPRLIGTCGAWFLYDFVTFPNGIFSSSIIDSVIDDPNDIKLVAEWTLLLTTIALPGVFVGAFLCEKIGRKYTMIVGFSGYLVFGLIVGCSYDKLAKIVPLFVIFYGLMQSSGNLGPGDMLGLVSSESYATGVRGTCYGISAAVGKAGAAIGTEVFTPIQNNLGKQWTFIIAAIVGVVGILVTFFFIPHLREDDLALEDIKFANFLRENGYDGPIGQDGDLLLANDELVAELPTKVY
jgi:MFS family permease